MTKPTSKAVDWLAIEPQYRAGIRPLRDIGAEFGVSDAAIIKRAKRDGWVRDLGAKIKAKAEAKVSKAVVSELVSKEKALTEQVVVEGYAQVQANTVMRHKKGIERAWRTVEMLFRELESQTEYADLYDELGVLMHAPDEKGVDKLNEIYRKAMSLPSRSSTAKTLLDALKTAIGLEREALGITDRTLGSDDDPLTRIIKAVQGSALKPVAFIEGESERVVNE